MRVIRSQVIVLISSSQNELQHPKWMQQLPELCNSKEAPRERGKVWGSGAVPHVRDVWGPAALPGSLDLTGITGTAQFLEHLRMNEHLKTQRILSLQKYSYFGRGEERKGKKFYTKMQNRLRLSLLVIN